MIRRKTNGISKVLMRSTIISKTKMLIVNSNKNLHDFQTAAQQNTQNYEFTNCLLIKNRDR